MEARQPDALVERMQGGDLDAFEEFFNTYKRPVYATALAITRDPFLAEEVLQDCFVKAYRVRERLDPARSPLPWLQRVTINLCYSRVSRRKALAEPITSLITNLVVDLAARPDQVVESREVLEVLQRGIDALPPKQQTAVILYYLHGYSLAEAAEIADCNVGTMKSRLHYALKALRLRLPVERRLPVGTAGARRAEGAPMSCRRICRELLWLARFGEFGPSSAPHLDHLAGCSACRDEVGFDRALVQQLRLALAERIASDEPSPSAWDVILERAPRPPGARHRRLPARPCRRRWRARLRTGDRGQRRSPSPASSPPRPRLAITHPEAGRPRPRCAPVRAERAVRAPAARPAAAPHGDAGGLRAGVGAERPGGGVPDRRLAAGGRRGAGDAAPEAERADDRVDRHRRGRQPG